MSDRIHLTRSAVIMVMAAIAGCATSPAPFKAVAIMVPAEYTAATSEALNFGVELKVYDDAAWIATDKVGEMGLANRGFSNASYVVEPMGDLYRVAFLFKDGDALKVAATVDVKSSGWDNMGSIIAAKLYDDPIPATDAEKLLFDALHSAGNAPELKLCSNGPYNHVVIPDERVGKHEYRVYFLLASDKPKMVPEAGHVLVRVAGDGETILEVRPLSLSCNIADASDPSIVGLGFINLVLDSPSEVQVFTYLRYKIPIFMSTKNGLMWNIDSNGISMVKR